MKSIPEHVVLFPDGNRRWAEEKHISVQDGYLKGKDKFSEFLSWCKEAGVKTVTVFGFSSENWKRPQDQVDFLMHLFETYLEEGIDAFLRQDIRVKVIGQREKLAPSLRKVVEKVEKETEGNRTLQLNLAVSYGGRWDIVNAARSIAKEGISPDSIDEHLFERYLSTAGLQDPDLVIRAGGEMRLSNFVLWQAAYAELFFSQKMWPDFTKEDFNEALAEYDRRQRRFGS